MIGYTFGIGRRQTKICLNHLKSRFSAYKKKKTFSLSSTQRMVLPSFTWNCNYTIQFSLLEKNPYEYLRLVVGLIVRKKYIQYSLLLSYIL